MEEINLDLNEVSIEGCDLPKNSDIGIELLMNKNKMGDDKDLKPKVSFLDDMFEDHNRNQINIAILGAVSAGKSTLLNTIFAETYSHCKIKRTTMTPQIYFEYEGKTIKKSSKIIKEENKRINDILIKKTENKEEITMDDIRENMYIVPKIKNFVKLEKDINLTIYDIPGLNDRDTKELYFQYLTENFYKFDIILFVVDINSALNTSDEGDMLNRVVHNCKNNYQKFNIHNKLLVLANKCDAMQYKDGNLELEEEHLEMFEQIQHQFETTINDIFPELDYQIIPISSEDSYIYRILEKNPVSDLDMKYINKFGYNEYGKTRWNRLPDKKKKAQISNLIEELDLKESLNLTGFNKFSDVLNSFLTSKDQKKYINNHIIYHIQKISGYDKLDIYEDLNLFKQFYNKYKSLEKRIKGGINTIKIFQEYLTNYLEKYEFKVMRKYIDIENNNILQENFINEVIEIRNILDSINPIFKSSVPIVNNYYKIVTNSLTNFYKNHIDKKEKPVSTLFEYLKQLLVFNKKPTEENITNFFSNSDMLNKTNDDIIEYIEKLEKENLLENENKLSHLLGLLIEKYTYILNNFQKSLKNFDCKKFYIYSYFSSRFWENYILNYTHNSDIDKLCFLSKLIFARFASSNLASIEYYEEEDYLLRLELYYQHISVDSKKNSISLDDSSKINFETEVENNVSFKINNSEEDDSSEYLSNSESIGDDIDRELGFTSRSLQSINLNL